MSDIPNSNPQLSIETQMQGNAAQGAADLSNQIVNLSQQLATLSQRAVQNANVTKAFNQSMGLSASGVSQFSRELSASLSPMSRVNNAIQMQKKVLDEATRSAEAYTAANKLMQKGSLDPTTVSRSNQAMAQSISHMKAMKASSNDLQKAMKDIALLDYSKRISDSAVKSQQAAYNFTRNFSMPIIAGLRESFFSYAKLATESNRTTKLILDNFAVSASGGKLSLEEQTREARKFTANLGKELDKITRDWGTSRVLIQSLAGDFAELGIASDVVLAGLTRMTAETEKLGNLDISQSSEFVQSMYQTILRLRRETGKSVDISAPDGKVANEIISQLKGQLAVFNLIENKTVMSLRNIADAFPEVTAAATSFGLSMTEATALVLPMVAAGFQVGASANSVKVSLQRMVAMTKQNSQIINQLNKEMGDGFTYTAGVGMHNIQQLADAYRQLSKDVSQGGKGKQGALELFSRLFGVRQGPRMETTIAQLAAFQTQLEKTGSLENSVAMQLQSSVNQELWAIGQKGITIKKFEDLSDLHRRAIEKDSKDVLTAQAAAIQRGQKKAQDMLEKNQKGNADFISGMSTEVGKALMAQAFDVNNLAGRQFEAELKLSQDTPEVRYRRAKESLMALGRSIVPVVDILFKGLLPILERLVSFLQNNPFVAKLISGFVGLLALSGPLRLFFTTMKVSFGSVVGIFVKLSYLLTGTRTQIASLADLIANPNLLRGQQRVVQYMDGFLIKSKRGAKELKEAYDFSGISLPAKEAILSGGIYGSDKAVNMKRIGPYVPETNQLMNDLKMIQAQGAAQMAAGVASASEEGVAKGTSSLADDIAMKFATVMHKFQGPNLFAGPNYFEGNVPFSGFSGGPGSSSGPRAPRGSGGIAKALTEEEQLIAMGVNPATIAARRATKDAGKQVINIYPKGGLFPTPDAKSFTGVNAISSLAASRKRVSGLFGPSPSTKLAGILGKGPLALPAGKTPLALGTGSWLSGKSIIEMFSEAGVGLEDQVHHALLTMSNFNVSPKTIEALTKVIKSKKGLYKLALTESGVDERMKGRFISMLSNIKWGSKKKGFVASTIEKELMPMFDHINASIGNQVISQVNGALSTIPARAIEELKDIKAYLTPMGSKANVLRKMKKIVTIDKVKQYQPVLMSEFNDAMANLFISIEDSSGAVIQTAQGGVLNHIMAIQSEFPDVASQGLTMTKTGLIGTGSTSKHGDMAAKFLEDIQNGVIKVQTGVDSLGRETVQIIEMGSRSIAGMADSVESASSDGPASIDFDKSVKEADKAAKEAALSAKRKADQAAKDAAKAAKAGLPMPNYVLNNKVEKARAEIKILKDAKEQSILRNATILGQGGLPLPSTEAELQGVLKVMDEALAEHQQELLNAKKEFQNVLAEADRVITEEIALQTTPAAKDRVQKAGLARLKELKAEHAIDLKHMKRYEQGLISRRSLAIDKSPAGIQRQIDRLIQNLPSDVRVAVQEIESKIQDEVNNLAVAAERRTARLKSGLAKLRYNKGVAGITKEIRAAVPMNPMWAAIKRGTALGSDNYPLDVFNYSGSRFFNDPRFRQPNATMFDARRGLSFPSSIKSFFGMDRVKGVFKAPKSLSAAALTQGEQIIFQFAEQLETQLGSVLANTAQADIKHITRVLQNLKPTSVSKDLAAFMTGIVNLPQDQIEMAMGNTLTEIKRAVTGQTGAGVGGKGMKAGSLQSWKAFLERMRRGSLGLDTDASGNPIVKGIREFFFSGKIKKGAINATSVKGISTALESAFVASMKGGFLGLGGKEDAGVEEVTRRLTVESNRPGLGRQRAAKRALKDAGKKATKVAKDIADDIEGFLTAPAAVMADIASKVDMTGAKSSSIIKAATDKVMKPIVKVYKPGELFPGRAPAVTPAITQAVNAATSSTVTPTPQTLKGLKNTGIELPATKRQAEKMMESAQRELARQLGIDAKASGASAKIKKLSVANFEKEIERLQGMIAGEQKLLDTFTSPAMRKGPEKNLAKLNKQLQDLAHARDKYVVAEFALATAAAEAVPTAPSTIAPTGATGATKPTAPPPRVPSATTPVIPTPVTPSATGGAGKIFNIDKIGHRFQGPNIFSDNIFSTNLKDVIPNFDELMAAPAAEAGASIAAGGEAAAAALTEAAVAVQSSAGSVTASNIANPASGAKKSLFSRFTSRLFGDRSGAQLTGEANEASRIIANKFGPKLLEKKLKLSFDDSGAIVGISRIKKLGGEMAISLDRANSILAGRLLPNFTRLKKFFSSPVMKMWMFGLTGGLSLAVKPAMNLVKSLTSLKPGSMLSNAKAAISNLEEARVGKKTGIVRKAMAGLSGATGGINSLVAAGSKAADIFFKVGTAIATVGSAILVALPILVLLFGLFQSWKSAEGRLSVVMDTLKQSLVNLKDAVVALFSPIRDMINGFFGASQVGGTFMTEGEKNASMFLSFANVIKKVTAAIKNWAQTFGKSFMNNQVVPFLTRMINRFILLAGAIKSALSGDGTGALRKFKAFFITVVYEVINAAKILGNGIASAIRIIAPLIAQIAVVVVQIFGQMLDAMWELTKSKGKGVAISLGSSLLNVLPVVGPAKKFGEKLGILPKSLGYKSGAEYGTNYYDGFAGKIEDLVNKVGNPIQGAFNSAMDAGLSKLGAEYAKLIGQGINIPLAQRLKNPKAYKEALAYNAKQSSDAATAAGESLGSNVANGVKDKMKEIKDTLKGYFYSNVDAKFDSIIQQYVDALEKQKDQQLKAYDDQIAGIDALADAESRLTAKKEYETKRRELLDQRETDNQNYLVERRLAVYEGRVFDVRKLDREELLSKQNSAKELSSLDQDRLSELQSEQRDLAKQAIANQKDLAEKQFQEVLDSFDRFIEDVKNKSFATQEEFTAAIQSVANKALGSSTELSDAFANGLGTLPAAVKSVTNPAIKMFSDSMDALINEASAKFGVDTNSKDPNSLLGAIGLLASGSEDGFKKAFSTTFAPLYVQPAVDAIAKVSSSLTEKGNKNNISEIWRKAGEDAFAKLKAELNRDIAFPKILDSFKNLIADLKPLVAQVVALAGDASGALSGIGNNATAGYVFTSQDRAALAQYLVKYAPTDAASREKLALNAPSVQRVVQVIADNYDKGSEFLQANISKFGLSGLEKVLLQAYLNSQMIGMGSPTLLRALPGTTIQKYNGGAISQYVRGGFLNAPASQGIPALLHGGEYIINHKAVERFGRGNLERINALKNGGNWRGFASGGYMTTPGFANGGYMTTPGFARGGFFGRRPKDSGANTPSDDSSLKTFTNKRGESYTVPNVNIRSGKATGTTMHMLDWAAIARSESGPNWENSLGAITKTSRGVFVGPLNISRKAWQTYSSAYKRQTGIDVGNFNNPNNIPSWGNQVKIAEMIAFKGIADSPYEYYRQPKFLDGFEGVRKNQVYFKPLSELRMFDNAMGFAKGGYVRGRRPKTGGSAGSIYDFDYRGVIPDRIEDKLRAKGIPSSRRQIPKEQDPNSRRRGTITPIIPPEKRYPQDGSYEVEAPWAGYTNQPDPPWIHHDRGRPDNIPGMSWRDRVGEPVGKFGFPVWYRHILGYYPTDRIPLGGKKGDDVSIEWNGKNRWTRVGSGIRRMYGGAIPQFKFGGLFNPGFGLPRLRSFGLPKLKNLNPLSWLFGKKKGGGNEQNQTTFEKKPAFDVNKEPWKTLIKNYKKAMEGAVKPAGGGLDAYIEQLREGYEEEIARNEYNVTLPKPQYVKNMPPQLASDSDAGNEIGKIAYGAALVDFNANNALRIRGLNKIYISPQYWNEENLFRNDADSAWRIAANKYGGLYPDEIATDHEYMMEMHKGVLAGMGSMSRYLNIPVVMTPSAKQFGLIPTIDELKKSMVLDVFGIYGPQANFAGQTYGRITYPNRKIYSQDSVAEQIRKTAQYTSLDLNVGLPDMWRANTPKTLSSQYWGNVVMHEFGHISGFGHPHEFVEELSKIRPGSNKNTDLMLNSIMSYDALDTQYQLLPADINAYKAAMGFGLSAPSLITRYDSKQPIFSGLSTGKAKTGGWDGVFLDKARNAIIKEKKNVAKKQLPKVKKFEQGGFIGPMLPKKKKGFWGKVGSVGKGLFNFGKEILRPKNSLAIVGGIIGGILGAPGGPAGVFAGGVAGSAAGGGIGSFIEQMFDKKKGFQPLDIAKNMLLQGALHGLGVGVGAVGERYIMPAIAKYSKPALRGIGDVVMNKIGLAGMDATAIPGLIKAGVSYTKSKALSLLGKGVNPLVKGVSKLSPAAGDYLKAFGGSWRQGAGFNDYRGPVEGWFRNIFRSDNIAIRAVRENKNKEFYDNWSKLNPTETKIVNGRPYTIMPKLPDANLAPYGLNKMFQPGPLTKVLNKIMKFNPFGEKIGIHVGRSGIEGSILPMESGKRTGPLDTLSGYTYAWLQDSAEKIANAAKSFAIQQEYGLQTGFGKLSDPQDASFYITKMKGIFDPNIMFSRARMSKSQKILQELPITSSIEDLYTALSNYRENAGIKGLFNKVRGGIARIRNFIKGESVYLHSSPMQGLTEIKPFAGAAIGNEDPLAFLKKATMQPGMTEGSWQYTGNLNENAKAGWGRIRGTKPAPAPGGSVYVVRGPRRLQSSSSIFDDVDPNSFVSKKALDVLSEIKIPNTFTQQEALNYVDSIVRRSVTRFGGPKVPRFEKGGYLKFKEGGEVPSILHGGEYVLNAAAVKKYGLAHLEAMNQMRFKVPSAGFSVPQSTYSGSMAGGMTTSTQNVNIYVDNFIGEPEWFNSMMKDYNTKILPKNQKAAGLESRVISTYNGLNRGQ